MDHFSILRRLIRWPLEGGGCRFFVWLVLSLLWQTSLQAAPFQWYSDNASCPNQSLCEMDLPVVPINRVVTIASVSCLIVHGSQSVEILYAQGLVVGPGGNTNLRDTFVPVLTGKGPLGSYFSFNQQTLLVVRAGSRVRISIATDAISSFFLQCKVAGDVK